MKKSFLLFLCKNAIEWLVKKFKPANPTTHTEINSINITGNGNTVNKKSHAPVNSGNNSIQQIAGGIIINNINIPDCETCAKGLFSSARSVAWHRETCKNELFKTTKSFQRTTQK